MAYAPIQLLSTPLEDYAGYWLKFYDQGTTTPLSMATDSTGGTLIVKAEISSGGAVPIGFIQTAGSALLNPFVNGDYDGWLFPTAAEADANDTTNAIQVADNLNADPESSLTVSDGAYTVADKAAAVLLQPVTGKSLVVEGTDGGSFKAAIGAAPGTYADDGGAFCGTLFIPTGGNGSTAWIRIFSGSVNLDWFGAKGTPTIDTSAIAAWLAVGGKLSLTGSKTYLFDASISPISNTTITGGNDSVLKLADSSNVHGLVLSSVSDIVIKNIKFDFNKANQVSAVDGIRGSNCTNIILQDLNIVDSINQGVVFFTSNDKVYLRNCDIDGCDINVAIANTTHAKIINGNYTNSTGASIGTKPYEANIYITASNGAVIKGVNSTGAGKNGIYVAESDDVLIKGGVFDDNGTIADDSGRGMSITSNCVRMRIYGNDVNDNIENGIYAGSTGSTDFTIIGNTCKNNNTGDTAGGHGIEINAEGSELVGNICDGNNNGISINADNVTASGNKCMNGTLGVGALFGSGIKVFDADNVKLIGNTCINNENIGIDVNGTANLYGLIAIGNDCSDYQGVPTQDKGIALATFANDSVCIGNTSKNNVTADIEDSGTNNLVMLNYETGTTLTGAYTPTNVVTDRSFNADAVVISELADVVGTLIADLQNIGIIK